MANYNEIFLSKLDWAMPFQRTGKFPLDRTDLFDSYDDAVKYAKGDTTDPDSRELCGTSYVGQTITVYEDDKVISYQIQADRTLKKVGSGGPEGKDNVIESYAYKIIGVTLCDENNPLPSDIIPEDNITYGYYTLNSIVDAELVGLEYSVQISQSFYCVGSIIKVEGKNVYVSNIPVDKNGEVIGLDTATDNLDAGVVRNVLIIADHPELGDTFMGYFNFAIGYKNKVYYRNSFSAGQANHAIGQSSATFGYMNKAGYMSFAAGRKNAALGQYSFIAGGYGNTVENGAQSGHAEGNGNTVKANHGHAEGNLNTVHPGAQSGHVEGDANGVFGYASHAGGTASTAHGRYSFVHGVGLGAYGRDSTVFGRFNHPGSWTEDQNDIGMYAFTVGNGKDNENRNNAFTVDWYGGIQTGKNCVGHTYGYKINKVSNILTTEELTKAGITPEENVNYGYYEINVYVDYIKDILEGQEYSVVLSSANICAGKIVKISGKKIYVDHFPLNSDGTPVGLNADPDIIDDGDINNYIMINNYPQYGDTLIGYFTTASGQNSYAFSRTAEASGRDTRAIGKYSHTHGRGTIAGYAATAFGNKSKALGDNSTAEGNGSLASGANAHAQNATTVASGNDSTAMGKNSKAIGTCSLATGFTSEASGENSLTGGYGSKAFGKNSIAFGCQNVVRGENCVAIGKYNTNMIKEDEYEKYSFIVGNGTSNSVRSNALTLDWDGNLEVQKSVKVPLVKASSVVLVAPDGSEFKLTVDNDGTLITVKE